MPGLSLEISLQNYKNSGIYSNALGISVLQKQQATRMIRVACKLECATLVATLRLLDDLNALG